MRLEEVNAKVLKGLSGQAREDFEAGLRNLNMANPADREALRESIRKLRPDFSEAQIDIMVSSKAPPDNQEWIQ